MGIRGFGVNFGSELITREEDLCGGRHVNGEAIVRVYAFRFANFGDGCLRICYDDDSHDIFLRIKHLLFYIHY